jgi:hypothetical protein
MRQPLPTMAYRVEIVVCCPRGHKLLPFHRITVPDLDDGVAGLGRFVHRSSRTVATALVSSAVSSALSAARICS